MMTTTTTTTTCVFLNVRTSIRMAASGTPKVQSTDYMVHHQAGDLRMHICKFLYPMHCVSPLYLNDYNGRVLTIGSDTLHIHTLYTVCGRSTLGTSRRIVFSTKRSKKLDGDDSNVMFASSLTDSAVALCEWCAVLPVALHYWRHKAHSQFGLFLAKYILICWRGLHGNGLIASAYSGVLVRQIHNHTEQSA